MLYLLADFFKFAFYVYDPMRNFRIVTFGSDRIGLAIHFLNKEIELSADGFVRFENFIKCAEVRAQSDKLFVDCDFIGKDGAFC